MSETLQRDMHSLRDPGLPMTRSHGLNQTPWLRNGIRAPTALTTYAARITGDLQYGGIVDNFMRRMYLYWPEALGLLESTPEGVASRRPDGLRLVSVNRFTPLGAYTNFSLEKGRISLVRDTRRFLLSHIRAIYNAPLQVYTPGLYLFRLAA